MSEQTQPGTALQSLAEKLRTDAIAIFGEGQAELDIIEWFYGALLAAAPAPVVPDGYVLVPVEPTAEMMMHESSCQHHAADDMSCPVRRTRRNIWARMLAAAPAHPAERQEQGEVQRLRDWIACVERLPADKRDVMVYCADSDEHMVGSSIGDGFFLFATAGCGEKVVCRPTHWRHIDESDKPDLAASTGQEVGK